MFMVCRSVCDLKNLTVRNILMVFCMIYDITRGYPNVVILCTLAKLRKATISFVMSVRPFVSHAVLPYEKTRLQRVFVKFDI
jgi:hypothetical protein